MRKVAIATLLLAVLSFANVGLTNGSVPPLLVVIGSNGGNDSSSGPSVLLDFPTESASGLTWPLTPFPLSFDMIGAAAPLLSIIPRQIASGIAFGCLLDVNGTLWTWGSDYLVGRNYSRSSNPTLLAPGKIVFQNISSNASVGITAITTTNSATIFAIDKTIYGFGISNFTTTTGLFGPDIATSATTLTVATQLFTLGENISLVKDVMCTSIEACSVIAVSSSGEQSIFTWGTQYGSTAFGVLARSLNDTDEYSAEPDTVSLLNISTTCTLESFVAVTKSCFFARCAENTSIVAWGYNEDGQCSQQNQDDGSLLPSVLTGLQDHNISKLACGESYCIALATNLAAWKTLAWGQFKGRNFSEASSCVLSGSSTSIYECQLIPSGITRDNTTAWVDVSISNNTALFLDSLHRFYHLEVLNSTDFWNITMINATLPPYFDVGSLSTLRNARGSLMYAIADLEDTSTQCMLPAPFVGNRSVADCISAVWVSSGFVNISDNGNAYLPSPMYLFGSYWVDSSVTLSVNATTILFDQTPILNVTGCISVLGTISVYFNLDAIADASDGSFSAVLWEGYANSTCNFTSPRNLSQASPVSSSTRSEEQLLARAVPSGADFVGPIILDPIAPRPRCSIMSITSESVVNEDGRTQVILNLSLSVDRSCERRDVWWIVLLGVSAIVIVLTAVLLTTFQCLSRAIEKQADKEWDDEKK